MQVFSKRPAEIIAGLAGLVAAAVQFGLLDAGTAAWLTAGLGLVPGVVSTFVDWYRARP